MKSVKESWDQNVWQSPPWTVFTGPLPLCDLESTPAPTLFSFLFSFYPSCTYCHFTYWILYLFFMLIIYYAPHFPVEPRGIWVPWIGRSRQPVSCWSWKMWGHPFPSAQVPQSPWQEPSRKAQTHMDGVGVLRLWTDTGLGISWEPSKFILLTQARPHSPDLEHFQLCQACLWGPPITSAPDKSMIK